MQTNYDNDLQSYFTDMEHLRGMFKDYVSAEKLSKRLIVFHGVGGVGKSSLLRMFRLHCKSEKIPVALASGDDAKSILDVITRSMEDLKTDGVKFSSLNKTLESYRAVQAKVEDQARKSQNKMADLAGKAASKTAEAAGGALLGAAIGSVVPGVGTAIGGMLGSAVGGLGAEALTDWLRGFLDKSSIDLLLDPAKKLTSDFLEDIAKAAEKKRLVLLLDTYEQMSVLEDWVGEVAQKIHPNVLMVIAGRKLPDWNRVWSGWMMNAQVEELKPMTEEVMRQLIHRYYATMRGGEPNPAQVDAIIKFARGLPMVVTSAVQLWVKYGVEDFQSVKAEIVANLVDRLMKGVPSSLIPALEAAAVVRWFDQPILRAVLNKEDVRDVYNELRRFPFVRTRVEGLALHDSVREIMDENLRVQDSERHSEFHERAAVYFEKRLMKVAGEEAERLGLERLYHHVRANEGTGIKLFQEVGDELTRYQFVTRLRELLNDVNAYPLEIENSRLWRKYYNAQLAQMDHRYDDAENMYEHICDSPNADVLLKGKSYSSWGDFRKRTRYIDAAGGPEKLIQIIKKSETLLPESLRLEHIQNLVNLAGAYQRTGNYNNALQQYEKAMQISSAENNLYEIISIYRGMLDMYARQGDWRSTFKCQSQMQEVQNKSGQSLPYLLNAWYVAWAWAGRPTECEKMCRSVVELKRKDGGSLLRLRDLGYSLGMQGKYKDSYACFKELRESIQGVYKNDPLAEYFRALVLLKQGDCQLAIEILQNNINTQEEKVDTPVFPESLYGLGLAYEHQGDFNQAYNFYTKHMNLNRFDRHYLTNNVRVGQIRIKYAQNNVTSVSDLLLEAEQLAQQYEYNDHLASLRLTQGHLAWETGNQNEALAFYQNAMTYALRYNRFLLDELLSGRPQETPLRPIIPHCLERGEEGKKILLALSDWWNTGVNDIGTPRPDTISPIPEGISLLEAEKIAREREPGDGSIQKSVIEQLER